MEYVVVMVAQVVVMAAAIRESIAKTNLNLVRWKILVKTGN